MTTSAQDPVRDAAARALPHAIAVQALTWLVAANAVGLLLATILAWPAAGAWLGPLTYGRWVPVHLDLHLYGWASLPLVALLVRAYFRASPPGRLARLAIHAWSAALLVGAVSWLAGGSSGKLFLEWSGGARVLLAVALGLLAVALLRGLVRGRATETRPSLVLKAALLAGLAPVPAILFWAAGPGSYPAINPDSGGATGSSLLGSTLGMVLVALIVPLLADLPRRRPRRVAAGFALLAVHFGAFLLLGLGNRSHHEPAQVAGLASVAAWIPLLAWTLRAFEWPAACRPWLLAFGAWGVVLVASGLAAFWPGMLERFKFTHALVAHAHVALAGFVTALDVVVLVLVLSYDGPGGVFASPLAFAGWHGGLAAHVAALTGLGVLEQAHPGLLFGADRTVTALLLARWVSGLAMLAASASWLARALAVRAARDEAGVPHASPSCEEAAA